MQSSRRCLRALSSSYRNAAPPARAFFTKIDAAGEDGNSAPVLTISCGCAEESRGSGYWRSRRGFFSQGTPLLFFTRLISASQLVCCCGVMCCCGVTRWRGWRPQTEGSLAASLAELQDLLVRPTQRVMKYQVPPHQFTPVQHPSSEKTPQGASVHAGLNRQRRARCWIQAHQARPRDIRGEMQSGSSCTIWC